MIWRGDHDGVYIGARTNILKVAGHGHACCTRNVVLGINPLLRRISPVRLAAAPRAITIMKCIDITDGDNLYFPILQKLVN